MRTQYFCKHKRRRQAVREHPTLNGIDYLEVMDHDAQRIPQSPRQRTLLVHCIKALPDTLTADNVKISGGVRITPINVEWAARAMDAEALLNDGLISTTEERDYILALDEPDHVLVVRTNSEGDYSTYRLCLVTGDDPLTGFDPLLTMVDFSFKVECPSEFDCEQIEVCQQALPPSPPIDYLAKDYTSFRSLMLDRLSVIMPDWQERLPADMGVVLVEVLAYAGDHLSYYQDAVATEAYLGTARRRSSIRRHARLLNYAMHDGCNARAWVTLQVEDSVENAVLQREYASNKPTRLITRIPTMAASIEDEHFDAIVARHQPEVFELLYDHHLFHVHNNLYFYTWGDEQCCLPKGATQATLRDNAANRLLLRPGDVLIFEEVRGPGTGVAADADPTHRHAVRLTHVDPAADSDGDGNRNIEEDPVLDELYSQPIVKITWAEEDALPFPLCLSVMVEERGEPVYYEDVSIAHGNVVLVDHGRKFFNTHLDTPTGKRCYRPLLTEKNITQRVAFDELNWNAVNTDGEPLVSAGKAMVQDPHRALPAVDLLSDEGETWRPARDLLASDRFNTDFVVETESDGSAALRFGDNLYGKRPEADIGLTANYRIGGGVAGNVGAEAIAHIVTTPGIGIAAVRNPIPAAGGTAPEKLEEIRQNAPQAFRKQERAVTESDYAAVAERHPEVSKAKARRRWTGSWHTMFITIDRLGGREVDQDFEEELSAFIERFQLAGHDVEIEPPKFISLDIALKVCVKPGYLRSNVKLALLETFSCYDLPDGRRGFFHPDNFTFGERVYLSRLIAAAMDTPGVRWVEIIPEGDPPGRFQRWGEKARTEIDDGYIDIGPFEIARLDNDPNAQENGKIEFYMEGGL